MWNLINLESKKLLTLCLKNSFTISLAESCTGGLISSAITHNPGSSEIYKKGYITYSNDSKIKELNVPSEIIKDHGAVSEETSKKMLIGLLKLTNASVGISVTGIAGPDGSTKNKPVGLVWISYGSINSKLSKKFIFEGDRLDIRLKTTVNALKLLNSFILDL